MSQVLSLSFSKGYARAFCIGSCAHAQLAHEFLHCLKCMLEAQLQPCSHLDADLALIPSELKLIAESCLSTCQAAVRVAQVCL